MEAAGLQAHIDVAPRRHQLEGRAQLVVERGVHGAHVALLDAEGEQLGARPSGHRHHVLVVGVQHGRARCRQGLDQLALGLGHALERTEHLRVGAGHVGNDADVGPGQLAQPGDMAEASGAH